MIKFITDLDNTLIYSHKHNIGNSILVEKRKGKPQSYMSEYTYRFLESNKNWLHPIPLTSRTEEQFSRITYFKNVEEAYICNGAIRLVNGIKDSYWFEESMCRANKAIKELNELALKMQEIIPNEQIRNIEGFMVYAVLRNEINIEYLSQLTKEFNNIICLATDNKYYCIPQGLDKGASLERIQKLKQTETAKILYAGDSPLDIGALKRADISIYPSKQTMDIGSIDSDERTDYVIDESILFSDGVCNSLLDLRQKGYF